MSGIIENDGQEVMEISWVKNSILSLNFFISKRLNVIYSNKNVEILNFKHQEGCETTEKIELNPAKNVFVKRKNMGYDYTCITKSIPNLGFEP